MVLIFKTFNTMIEKSYCRLCLLLCIMVVYGFQCDDCETYTTNEFILGLGEQLVESTYQVGDTLIIKQDHFALLDLESGNAYDNRDGELYFFINMLRVKRNNERISDGLEYFDIETKQGKFSAVTGLNKEFRGRVLFDCDSTLCRLELNIIPKKVGYYAIHLTRGYFGSQALDDCTDNLFTPQFSSDQSNHFEICNEIGTDRIFVAYNSGSSSFLNLNDRRDLIFFKVTE